MSKAFIILLSGFFLLTLFVYYLASPLAKVGAIEVSGNEQLTNEEILEITGLKKGMHLWRFPLARSKDKLLASPWIAQAQVRWQFPNSVLVTVVERQGVAVVKCAAGNWVIAEDKVVLAASDGYSLPWLTGLEVNGPLSPGAVVNGKNCERALVWLKALQPLAGQISEINFEDYPVMISVFTGDGVKALFNPFTDPTVRLKDYALLLEELRRTDQKGIIDLRGLHGRGFFTPWPENSSGN